MNAGVAGVVEDLDDSVFDVLAAQRPDPDLDDVVGFVICLRR